MSTTPSSLKPQASSLSSKAFFKDAREKRVEEWMELSGQSFHAVLPVITPTQAQQMGHKAFCTAIGQREEIIQNERLDPLRNGWEPPIWWICDAFMKLPFAAPAWEVRFPDADWKEWSAAVRRRFGLVDYWRLLLVEGANRASKSEYAAKRVALMLVKVPFSRVWCFHSNNDNSEEYQQPLIRKYLPIEWAPHFEKRGGAMSFNNKHGFTDNKFVTPTNSRCSFRTYEQEKSKIEGGEINLAWCDELVPADWLETLKARVATRNGSVLTTFTPVEGYTPAVRMFEDGSHPLLEVPAHLVPRDGGEPDEAAAFGFASLADMHHAHDYKCWSLAAEFEWMERVGIES